MSLRAMEALGGFDALEIVLSEIFKHSVTEWDFSIIVDQILAGRAPVAPPNPPLQMGCR